MIRHLWPALLAASMLAACATSNLDSLQPGASTEQIRAEMGSEVASYALPGGGKRLEFRGRGARTYMVDVDAAGKMVRAEQVLTPENFRTIQAGMTAEQVRMALGQPSDVAPGGRQGGQIWSYNFQNTQCQWFQVAIGADGRTTGPGVTSLLPPCMQAI